MAIAAVTLSVTEATKSVAASAPFALREIVPVTVSPAAAASGTCLLSLSRYSVAIAEATLTNGTGSLDLSTPEAAAVFEGMPLSARILVDLTLWSSTDNRLVAKGRAYVLNNPAAATVSLTIGSAGELSMTLAATLAAGTPVMRDDAGKAAVCLAANAHRLIGVLRTGGTANAAARVVTAGIPVVSGWGLVAGSCYYLPTSGTALTRTAPDGYNVRPVGIALSATALAIIPHPTIQTVASGPHYLTWDAANRRMLAAAPAATSAGAADADRIPCLGADGRLSTTLLPDQTASAVAAVRAIFAETPLLDNPSYDDLIAAVNALITLLKGA